MLYAKWSSDEQLVRLHSEDTHYGTIYGVVAADQSKITPGIWHLRDGTGLSFALLINVDFEEVA